MDTNSTDKPEEIIFQVKINRESEDFELVSSSLSKFEHTCLIEFLESYVRANKSLDVKQVMEDYGLTDINDEEE